MQHDRFSGGDIHSDTQRIPALLNLCFITISLLVDVLIKINSVHTTSSLLDRNVQLCCNRK